MHSWFEKSARREIEELICPWYPLGRRILREVNMVRVVFRRARSTFETSFEISVNEHVFDPDQKFFLVGKRITPDFLADLRVPI